MRTLYKNLRLLLKYLFAPGVPMLLCLWAAPANAQPAPLIGKTLQTTDTSTTSVQVGCAIGSSTCTGGISAGPIQGTLISLSSGYVEIQSNVPASQTNRLVNNGGTLQWNGSALAVGGAVGPGTVGKLTKFTGATAIGDSICSESGTTITCVNTVSATTLTGTLSTASQTAITGVGTITAGTWNATKIGLLYGGTNADLSGTGGTSQFLRQNTLGGAVTVVRPQVSDLSDASNVALINASNSFTGTTQTINETGGGTAPFIVFKRATGSANTSVGGAHWADSSGTLVMGVESNQTIGSVWEFNSYSGGTPTRRVSIDLSGNITVTGNYVLSNGRTFLSTGTPTINTGCGTSPNIGGNDSSFTVLLGTGGSTSCTVNLANFSSGNFTCTANGADNSFGAMGTFPTAATIQISWTNSVSSKNIYVTCIGR